MTESFTSVWDAISNTPEESANMILRSELMQKITEIITDKGWTQIEAATQCGITQPRMNDLIRGRIQDFRSMPLSI